MSKKPKKFFSSKAKKAAKEKKIEKKLIKKTLKHPISEAKGVQSAQTQTQHPKKVESPKNHRPIAEKKDVNSVKPHSKSLKKIHVWMYAVSIALLIGIVLTGFGIYRSYLQLQNIKQARNIIQGKLSQWEQVAASHPSYRDADVQVALLAYQLGDVQKARMYTEKALNLDPNFLPALQLKGILITTK